MKVPNLQTNKTLQFGHRPTAPRACVVDAKPHIRTFLAEALEDLGFVACHCGRQAELPAVLRDTAPDLVILGLLVPESDVTKALHSMAASGFRGKVMLFGGRASPVLLALHELGEQIGLAMLPPLRTPFRDSDLTENLSAFLPIAPPPEVQVDAEQALRNGWLEVWYQPKIDLRRMSLAGAEALIRLRHPAFGVVAPQGFDASASDPQLLALSDFLVERVMSDWTQFAQDRPPIGMTIRLPMAALESPAFIDRMCLQLPDHVAYARLTVEINSIDVSRDPVLARQAARQLAAFDVGVSIDDVMAESSWLDLGDFPIAELQVERSFIAGCADDRHKRAACGMVLSIAARIGAQTVAKGIETSADFKTVCDLGFDHGQGPLFAKPMDAARFARTVLRGRSVPAR